ncbi:MAG: urea transporter [Thermodesulfovibrionales bacterium]|nr:urea transporter [Thermodesulfovibrionales bacterium]
MKQPLLLLLDALILSYSRIFFSESKATGIFIFLATMTVPAVGIAGILCALLCNITSYAWGLDRKSLRQGFYGFNGVLTGLALGFFYEINSELIFLIFLISVTLVFTTVLLNNIFSQYLGLPAMSMPFNIAAWLSVLVGSIFASIKPSLGKEAVLNIPQNVSEGFISTFLMAISSIIFQTNILSGIIISIGVLIYSRIAFVLMLTGFSVGLWIHYIFDISLIDIKYSGFNYIFSALAIGGIFTIPSAGSLFLSVLAAALSVVILAGLSILMPANLSSLALPFNLAVFLMLYGLRSRLYPSLGVNLAVNGGASPEGNLRIHRESIRQWKYKELQISLPFYGTWKVTQGISGEYTHKEDWRFAYDFQAVGSSGSLYRNKGESKGDYFAYGLPVIAPADGMVWSAKDGILDNSIGKLNTEERWGNYVIIKHADALYSCIAHLKKGSVKAEIGQTVKKGEVIASCGNSGRSPYPHIHMQFQISPEIGAPTVSFEFSNVCIVNGDMTFLPKGIIQKGMMAQNLTAAIGHEKYFPYCLNKEWVYNIDGSIESWRLDVDFYGNTFLVSSPKVTKLYFTLSEGVLRINSLDGRRDTGLYLFGRLITEAPFVLGKDRLRWTMTELADYGVHPIIARFFDIFAIIGFGLLRRLDNEVSAAGNEILLKTDHSIYLKTLFAVIPIKRLGASELLFTREFGLKTLRFKSKELNLL